MDVHRLASGRCGRAGRCAAPSWPGSRAGRSSPGGGRTGSCGPRRRPRCRAGPAARRDRGSGPPAGRAPPAGGRRGRRAPRRRRAESSARRLSSVRRASVKSEHLRLRLVLPDVVQQRAKRLVLRVARRERGRRQGRTPLAAWANAAGEDSSRRSRPASAAPRTEPARTAASTASRASSSLSGGSTTCRWRRAGAEPAHPRAPVADQRLREAVGLGEVGEQRLAASERRPARRRRGSAPGAR